MVYSDNYPKTIVSRGVSPILSQGVSPIVSQGVSPIVVLPIVIKAVDVQKHFVNEQEYES